MKKLLVLLIISTTLLASCAANVDIQKIKLAGGQEYEVAKTRSGVDFADCGTQLVSYLFDANGKFIDSKSERGQALHCDITVELFRAGGYVGGAAVIANGVQRAAKAAANASNTLEINNANTNNAEGYYSGNYSQTGTLNQSQSQTMTGGIVNPPTIVPPNGHGNNGFGNGGGDGSPNGKQDHNR